MRLGVLGGSFNPVHAAHVRLALEMGEALALDGVELIPAARPPHKPEEGMLPFTLRAELVEKAVEGLPGLRVNRMEADRPGPSYTWDTLAALRNTLPEAQLYFILGAGDLLCLHQWRRGTELGALANLAVASRDSHGRGAVQAYLDDHPELGCELEEEGRWRLASGNVLHLVDIPRLDISASLVRQRFLQGRSLRCLTPPAVERELSARRAQLLRVWG